MRKLSLAAARVNAEMTQADLAEKIGVTRGTVCLWENGKLKPSKRSLMAFCMATGVSEDELFLPEESTK